jgi:putative membrane protein
MNTMIRPLVGGAALLGVGAALLPEGVIAHAGAPVAPHDLRAWSTWLPEPLVLLGLAAPAWLYGRGVHRLQRRGAPSWRWRLRTAAFGGGLLALLFALASPLEALSGALLWAHMVQHLVLVLVAAPLLVLGTPHLPLLLALPIRWQRAIGRLRRRRGLQVGLAVLTALPVAWFLQAVALLIWHIPALYEAVLSSTALHSIEHGSFLGTALLFWWAVLRTGVRARLRYGHSVVALFLTALLTTGFGALMTFARTPWYPAYAPGEALWDISPLMDQRTAGLIMWMPGGLVYAMAAVALLALWLQAVEREMQRRDRTSEPDDAGTTARPTPSPDTLSFAGARQQLSGGEER